MTRRSIVRARARALMLTGLAFATVAPAFAQETITYTYDNKGRLITVNHNGGPSNGVNASYTYDNADNRTNVAVTGAGTTTITLAPTSLPGGTVNSAYSQTITASGGSSPYTFSYTGTLPTGLSLSSSGILSGTPTSTGTYSFTVTATDSASHTGSRAYSVTIAAAQTCVGVSFAVANVSANEGSNLSFTVTKSGATSNTCTVNYATANGTAVSGTNYTANSGTLSFASSTTSQAVTVATIDDHVVTGALTMDLNLSSPSGSATISDNQGVGTINNIDTGSTNHAPVCATITMNIDHRATTTVHVTSSMILSPCSDADGDTLTVTSPATPYDISVVTNGPPITSVNTVSDGHGGSTTQTIQINRT